MPSRWRPTPAAAWAAALILGDAALQISGIQSTPSAYVLTIAAIVCTFWAIFTSKWVSALHRRYGSRYPVLSLIVAASIGAIVFGGGWFVIGKVSFLHSEEQSPLVPSNQPEPHLQTGPMPEEIAQKFKELGLNPEEEDKRGKAFIEDALRKIPSGALRVYLGRSTLAYTTKSEQVVLKISGREILKVRKARDGGILIDAQLFGSDNRIIAGISSNVFFPNKGRSDYWRYERPNASSLIVYDQLGDKGPINRIFTPKRNVGLRKVSVFRSHCVRNR